ncbi:MAG TPA: PDR/VanB family oxidoreductase [Vicinamibacterales bacterium]|nr:PDR/VanB family oxidoreductase [Vicinamibacterales bacterium]
MSVLKVLVRSIRHEAEGIRSIELVPTEGVVLPGFTAGAHIDVSLQNGLVRSYSLINPQGETDRYVIAVNKDRASRGGSKFVHESVAPGDLITVSEPRNNFPLSETREHAVLIAGGIGITPIWAMVQRLSAIGATWELHYACRTRRNAAFLREIEALGSARGCKVNISFDQEPGGKMLDLGDIVRSSPPDSHFYCCGPTPMLEAYQRATEGLPPSKVSMEMFAAPVAAAATSGTFKVVLAKKGVTLVVEEGTTILETLLQNGIKHNYSCTQGICGTCETVVLEGIPEHRDWVLTGERKTSNKTMMICCSGSRTESLVLDI